MTRFWVSLLAVVPLWAAEPVDWVISARQVVTMDKDRRVLDNGAIAVRADRIVAVGTRAAIEKQYKARHRLDKPQAVILPGLINTHTHAPMSLMRGIADDMRLQEWLEKFIFPAEAKNVSPDFCRTGTRLACLEMMLSGTTTFTDMYYFEEVIAEAAKEAGMRGVLGQTVIAFPVPDAKTPADALVRAEAFLKRFAGDPLIVAAVAPHALYTNSDESLRQARALANRYQAPLLIHLSETKRENDEMQAKRGMSPTRVLDSLGLFAGRTVAAHAVWTDEADWKIFQQRGVGVAHCPSSNMKLSSGVAPVVAMLRNGVAVGLGTDGPAGSNNDLNMMEEMDLAAKLQKVSTGDPQALPAMQALEMATVGGAKVLGMSDQIGSLEPGKKADWIAVGLNEPHAQPLYNIYSQIVYALKGSDVTDVMINGRMTVRNRSAITLSARTILEKAAEYRAKILSSLPR